MSKIVSCLQDIYNGLIFTNILKKNGPKTEFSVHGTDWLIDFIRDYTPDFIYIISDFIYIRR